MGVLSLLLIGLAALCWLSGFVFLFRIPLCRRSHGQKDYPSVSIIIPARNEEHNIGRLLDSITGQTCKPDEIIVVDDGSTDRTADICRQKGATVLPSKPLPSGWLGKPWACYQGAKQATGDLFVFLDADTAFAADGLRKLMDTYVEVAGSQAVMSLAPFHRVKRFYEDLSALFNIIMLGSMNAFTPFKSIKTTGLFGPSLVVARDHYFAVDGHAAVKERILENVFLAAKFRARNLRLLCLGGRGTLHFRMYPNGVKELINGWTKAFASGSGEVSPFALLLIILWITAGFLIAIFLIYGLCTGWGMPYWLLLYAGYALQMAWMLRRIGSYKLVSALLFPLHLLFYCVVFFRSLYFQVTHKSTAWKSREVTA